MASLLDSVARLDALRLALNLPERGVVSLTDERITELVVIIALLSAGLKLRAPLTDSRWHHPIRLASVSIS